MVYAQTEGYGREFYRFGLELGGGLFLIKDINPGVEGSSPMYITPGSGGSISRPMMELMVRSYTTARGTHLRLTW